MKQNIKIAYIGGGSRNWAIRFMQDLAYEKELKGEVCLYDIDLPAAKRNQIIGTRIQKKAGNENTFTYTVSESLEGALLGADFVLISILPGTFEDMRIDVHAPEKYGIYQSVGDTAGPGGLRRAVRTVPIFEGFALAIKEFCPDAWVINLTNPMSILVKTLYRVFPEIKAFGCCHEVFHTQALLCCMLKEMTGIDAHRRDIYTDASGINHFTWITEAKYQDMDLMKFLPSFIEKHFVEGFYESGTPDTWKTSTFAYGNRVKMDLYNRFGALAAAGDRHLVEFVNNNWYLKDPKMVEDWHFGLTTVDWRIDNQQQLIRDNLAMAEGTKDVPLAPSDEELVRLIRGICGLEVVVSNVNLPNAGQMPGIPNGSIVETNCVFTHGFVNPIVSKRLPEGALALVRRSSDLIDLLDEAIATKNTDKLFAAFIEQPLCSSLSYEEAENLFHEMMEGILSL